MANVLIIEDDARIYQTIGLYLKQADLACYVANNAMEGKAMIQQCNPDLIVLDIMLPDGDGFEICRQIRTQGIFVPILMLTARSDEENRVRGLSLGADDYLTKPFSARELVARIQSLLRRAYAEGYSSVSSGSGVAIDPLKRYAYLNGEKLDLRGKEFDLVRVLAASPGRAYSREDLLERVWGYDFEGDVRIVDVYIRKLREKIEQDSAHPEYIQTVWGVGYRFKVDEA
jgi:DNA-binding response OmpR family regulator